jgi:hypothetical protein
MNRIPTALTTLATVLLLAACQSTAQLPAPSATPAAPVPSTAPSGVPVDPNPSATPPVVAEPTPTPDPTTNPTTAPTPATATPPPTGVVPAAPTGVRMTVTQRDLIEEGYYANLTTTIAWKTPLAAGTEIRVYGVTKCFAPPSGGSCLVEHTALPSNVRDLIASAPAAKGKVSWTWPNWEDVGGAVMAHGDTTYQAIVIAAYDSAGHSKFVIVKSGQWCPDCTY